MRGGYRPNSGRKPLPSDQKKVQRTVVLAPDTDRIVLANRCAGDSYASTLDRIVREWAERSLLDTRSL